MALYHINIRFQYARPPEALMPRGSCTFSNLLRAAFGASSSSFHIFRPSRRHHSKNSSSRDATCQWHSNSSGPISTWQHATFRTTGTATAESSRLAKDPYAHRRAEQSCPIGIGTPAGCFLILASRIIASGPGSRAVSSPRLE
jgi:hypothetical protein